MVGESKPPESLAERFWSLARGMEGTSDSSEPLAAVEHVLAVLDALDAGKVGSELTANTVNFLTLLRQHEVKGDLLYASPEQARGEQVDERSLVFSVGVLLFEKLTGRHPFGAEGNPQRLARMQRGEMASGVNYFPRVPAELRLVLLKAMGPFPEERWNSLVELRAQLDGFVGRARDPGRGQRAQTARPLPALPGGPEPPRRRVAAPSPTPPPPASPPPIPAPPPTPSAEIDLTRMARMTGRHSAIRADTDPVSAEAALRALARRLGPRVVPGAWAFAGVLVGAALTSIIFLAVWPDEPAIAERAGPTATAAAATTTPPTPAPAATAVASAASPEIAAAKTARQPTAKSAAARGSIEPSAIARAATAKAAAAKASTEASATANAATAKAAAAKTSTEPSATANAASAKASTEPSATANAASARAAAKGSIEPAPPARAPSAKAATAPSATAKAAKARRLSSGVFDPGAGGDAALVAVRGCVAADRKVQFGASLYYDAESGLSRRVYFGAIEQLDAPERACLDTRLIGLPAGAPPEQPAVVTYSFHLSPTGDQVKARLNPSP